MIKKLQQNNKQIAEDIQAVFQASYAVEAKLLNANDFPPLKRPLRGYIESDNAFYGFFTDQTLAAVVEINHTPHYTHIQSLVVLPKFFRQGIARKLMNFVFENYDSNKFVVETGVGNGPATTLYKNFGFIEVKQWDTDFGIRKIKFEMKIIN